MPALFADLAFTLRQLVNHRVYAITAMVSMALGITATAAVYSVLYGVLIDPTHVQGPDRYRRYSRAWDELLRKGSAP
jgi:hypothetical protein